MEAEKIKWEEKIQNVYDKGKCEWVNMKFFRLNVSNDYNHGMYGADDAD